MTSAPLKRLKIETPPPHTASYLSTHPREWPLANQATILNSNIPAALARTSRTSGAARHP